MNREIIFRGKTFDNKWIQGYLFKSWNDSYILWGTTNGIPNMTEVQSDTVGQYVGIKDCNDKRVFEGDLLDVWYCDPIGESHLAKGVIIDSILSIDLHIIHAESIKIVGNIYE